jgi:xylulokinase
VSALLGIDVGTSSTKGVLVNPAGELLARTDRPHQTPMPKPGWFEHDAERVWWAETAAIGRELCERGDEVAGVCVSGIGPCALVADASGRPLRRAILYGIDTRAEREIDELERELGAEAILARCGSPLTSQSVGPKLRWIQRHEPAVWDATRTLLMPSSLAVLRLTGEYVLDHHSASQCQPLYDLERAGWNEEIAELVAPGLRLPRLLWPGDQAGVVSPAAAAETGIPAGTPVAAGTIDAWAEAISVGLRRPGELMLMYGTTMFMIGLAAEARPNPGLWLTRWAFPEHYSRAAGLATAGALTDWFGNLSSAAYGELELEARDVPAGAGGLLTLPYFAGERTPLFDPAARGVICGLHLGHGRGHIYRALLEGTAFAVRHNVETMRAAGDDVGEIVAVGGGTRGELWTRIVSDVTGLPQRIPSVTVGASYGDALLAAVMTGLADPGSDWNPTATVVEPRAAGIYDDLYGRFRALYRDTRESSHWLAEFQRESAGAGAAETGSEAAVG